MNEVLFLDFDGVLLPSRGRGYTADSEAVFQLNRIIKEINPFIVISSSWKRMNCDFEELLADWGVKNPRLQGTTDNLNGLFVRRGHEIESWLRWNTWCTDFLILDDEADMCHLWKHLIQTNPETGITKKDADRVIREFTAMRQKCWVSGNLSRSAETK